MMNMKKTIAGVMVLCLIGGALPLRTTMLSDNSIIAFAEDDYTEGTYECFTYKKYSDHIEITKYDDSLEEVTVPAEIDGLPVTIIGERAFLNCSKITKITLPDTITSINESAFKECRNIKSIIIPDSVTNIGNDAFAYCESLESIKLSENLLTVGYGVFSLCTSLKSVTIPASVEKIDFSPFYDCESLESVNVAEGNQNYVSVDGIFFTKDKSELICYPPKKEGTSYTVPDGVRRIDSYAFHYCSALESITLPEGVEEIGSTTFYKCTSLKSIIIPESVEDIGSYVFKYCTSLTEITIPKNVKSIGDYVFEYCSSLKSIMVSEENDYYLSEDGILFNKDKSKLICCPIGKEIKSYKIPDSVTDIEYHAFAQCSSIESITIPDSVENINSYAFSECTSLKSVTLPDSIVTMGGSVFNYCTALESVTIPDSIKTISDYSFYKCENLADITIKNPECEIENSYFTIAEKATIRGYENSTAQAYAEKYGRKFEIIDGDENSGNNSGDTTDFPSPMHELVAGDIDGDNLIDASDASFILAEYSALSTSKKALFNKYQKVSGDVNGDGLIDANDASVILGFYSYLSTGGKETNLKTWFNAQEN